MKIKRNLILTCLLAMLVLLALPAAVEAQFTFTTNNGAIAITGYTGSGGAVTIPAAITGLPVTSIGGFAFYGWTNLTDITMGTNITSIGQAAFYDCTSLNNVTIPNSVTNIGDNSFEYCSTLANVTISTNVTSIGNSVFTYCGLTSVTLPDNVTSVGGGAFYGCTSLTNIIFSTNLASIGQAAFYDCSSLPGVMIPNSVTSLGNSAFEECYNLTKATIGTNLTSIATGVFTYCGLTSFTIPNTVTSIGVDAFYGCTNLSKVMVGTNVNNIGQAAFYACNRLTGVYFYGSSPTNADSTVFLYDNNATIYYLAGMTGWGATFDGRPTLKVVNPTLAITAPVNGQRWSNIIFTVKGTVSDNAPGSNVWIQVNANGWLPATTSNQWTNWSAAASLVPGTNVLRAYAANIFGSLSTTSQLSFDFVVTNQLSVRAIGLGTVSPNYSNSWLEVGRNYSITATPGSGFVVTNWMISTNWLGGRITNNATVQFMMQSNLTLQPTFADVTKPTITITAPTNLQKMTNALASVVGTASDNWKVAGVWYQLNNGAWNLSPTTNSWTNWTTTLQLITGTNTMKAYAVDLGGNFSTTNSVSMVASNTFKLQLSFTNAVPLKMNGLTFSLQLSTGLNGHIQVSTNLTSWTMLTNFVGTNSIITFCDPAATNSNRRFYRAVVP